MEIGLNRNWTIFWAAHMNYCKLLHEWIVYDQFLGVDLGFTGLLLDNINGLHFDCSGWIKEDFLGCKHGLFLGCKLELRLCCKWWLLLRWIKIAYIDWFWLQTSLSYSWLWFVHWRCCWATTRSSVACIQAGERLSFGCTRDWTWAVWRSSYKAKFGPQRSQVYIVVGLCLWWVLNGHESLIWPAHTTSSHVIWTSNLMYR